MIIETLKSPSDLKKMSNRKLEQLAKEIRESLIRDVSKTGGHLSSNLGIVELTLAMYSVFDLPKDRVVWDVGHQAYVHKILTGRKDRFDSLRQKNGLSGFTRIYESQFDQFNSGHASNSISLAYGLAKARDLKHEDGEVIAVIGDGALTGGLAYEALNNAGKGESKIIVVINDNEMSIGHNVGHISQSLSRIRTRKTYMRTKLDVKKILLRMPLGGPWLFRHIERLKRRIKYFLLGGVLLEEMGFVYLGPVDGHDIKALRKVMREAKKLDESVAIHVRTQKGKGFAPAEKDPALYHGIGPFDPKTGEPLCHTPSTSWSEVFGKTMVRLAQKDKQIAAISAAMVDGTGLTDFARYYPERMFDVGIAEEHAVTFAAGLAKAGMKPVVAVYSTFLQRAYDSIVHDICMNQLPVILAVDRAGVVGEDGESHQGIYDLAYLGHIPNLTVMAPADQEELKAMLESALSWQCPCAIRYPRGCVSKRTRPMQMIEPGKAEVIEKGHKIAILALGDMVEPALEAAAMLKRKNMDVTLINARFVSPLDEDLIFSLKEDHDWILTVEDHIEDDGFGARVSALLSETPSIKVHRLAIPNGFLPQGTRAGLLKECGLDSEGIARVAEKLYKG